jgi:hypothetical protein
MFKKQMENKTKRKMGPNYSQSEYLDVGPLIEEITYFKIQGAIWSIHLGLILLYKIHIIHMCKHIFPSILIHIRTPLKSVQYR